MPPARTPTRTQPEICRPPARLREKAAVLACLTMLALAGCDRPPAADASEANAPAAPIVAAEPPAARDAMALLFPKGAPKGYRLSLLGSQALPGAGRQAVFISAEPTAPLPAAMDGIVVGAVVFAQTANGWRAETVQGHIATIGQVRMTDDPVEIARLGIGRASVAFLVPDGGYGQGISEEGSRVLAYDKGRFSDLGFVRTGANNQGACSDDEDSKGGEGIPCWEYTGTLSAQPGSSPDHFDLKVRRSGEHNVNGAIVPAKDVVCTFDGKKYVCPDDD